MNPLDYPVDLKSPTLGQILLWGLVFGFGSYLPKVLWEEGLPWFLQQCNPRLNRSIQKAREGEEGDTDHA